MWRMKPEVAVPLILGGVVLTGAVSLFLWVAHDSLPSFTMAGPPPAAPTTATSTTAPSPTPPPPPPTPPPPAPVAPLQLSESERQNLMAAYTAVERLQVMVEGGTQFAPYSQAITEAALQIRLAQQKTLEGTLTIVKMRMVVGMHQSALGYWENKINNPNNAWMYESSLQRTWSDTAKPMQEVREAMGR
jgi:hypothetical protein